jgi:drug/metabolite transporter (DMT)-like permease
MTPKNRSLLKLLLALLTWSSSYAITRSVVATMPPILFAFLRFVVAILALLLISYTRRSPVQETMKGKWGSILTLSLTGVTLYYVFFNFSLQQTSAAAGALIQGFIPISTAILAAIFLKEKLKPLQIVGIFISVAGVVLIGFTGQANASGGNTIVGNLLMIAAVLCWAIYTVVSKKLASIDPIWLITRLSIIGTVLLIPAVIVEMKDQPWPTITWQGWAAILYMGIFPSALGYIWFNSALQHISATQAGVLINMDPVVGALIAVAFLGEQLHVWQITGAALTLLGVWLYMFRNR